MKKKLELKHLAIDCGGGEIKIYVKLENKGKIEIIKTN